MPDGLCGPARTAAAAEQITKWSSEGGRQQSAAPEDCGEAFPPRWGSPGWGCPRVEVFNRQGGDSLLGAYLRTGRPGLSGAAGGSCAPPGLSRVTGPILVSGQAKTGYRPRGAMMSGQAEAGYRLRGAVKNCRLVWTDRTPSPMTGWRRGAKVGARKIGPAPVL
ncbi:hypothetical protein NDU88_002304 [Pleurodeles waltl]|uniref:Uncharacterized protein n=1 Tax=Pleurodeles waltl TaxID=8319 RepID=A0AAV7KUD6_PLEWA|nr:hypothetical protein NDU88_002304 [Pleurodeles waltl]